MQKKINELKEISDALYRKCGTGEGISYYQFLQLAAQVQANIILSELSVSINDLRNDLRTSLATINETLC